MDENILEKPKETLVTDLQSYLKNLKLEMNIKTYEYIIESVAGTNFVAGIRLHVSVLGVIKPVDVKFSELGFNQTRLSVEDADKIFKDQ